MTRLPHENRHVAGLAGPRYPRYRAGPLCSAPACSRLADHAHHIWRRSFLAGDFYWVSLWDGRTVGNVCGLCHKCHLLVTENLARIVWTGDLFCWAEGSNETGFALDPQPPIWGAERPQEPPRADGPASREKCPTCKRSLPQERTGPREAARVRKDWKVSVPVDERENGADVLDSLLRECATLFGHDEDRTLRYFTLVQALALVVQHGHMLVGDGARVASD